MGYKSCPYEDVITFIIYQQFFREPNFIIDRSAKKKIRVENSDLVIKKLKEKIIEHCFLFVERKEKEFIKALGEDFGIETNAIVEHYTAKIESLAMGVEDLSFKMTMALSGVFSSLQKNEISRSHSILREKLGKAVTDKRFTEILNTCAQYADNDLSLLHNLSILTKYSQIVDVQVSPVYFDKHSKLVMKKILKLA